MVSPASIRIGNVFSFGAKGQVVKGRYAQGGLYARLKSIIVASPPRRRGISGAETYGGGRFYRGEREMSLLAAKHGPMGRKLACARAVLAHGDKP